MLDSEDLEVLSELELFDLLNRASSREDAYSKLKRRVQDAIAARDPFRVGDNIVVPKQAEKWKPFDKTHSDLKSWCGSAKAFVFIAGIGYFRTTAIESLAIERGEDPKTVLSSLGQWEPSGAPIQVVPILKAAAKYRNLSDLAAETT